MEVSERELRDMVRASIAAQAAHGEQGAGERSPVSSPLLHVSHALLPLSRGGDESGACVIEPSVRCTHCGYCVSFGH